MKKSKVPGEGESCQVCALLILYEVEEDDVPRRFDRRRVDTSIALDSKGSSTSISVSLGDPEPRK